MPPKGDEDFVPKKKEGECVKVVVRVRPLSKKEIQDGHDEATKADEDSGRITCQNPKADADEPPKTFTFDAVFAPSITQRKLYDVCSAPVVASVLEGFNGTIFAYGQTGAGKTFSMIGPGGGQRAHTGVLPQAAAELFRRIARAEEDASAAADAGAAAFEVRATFVEVHRERAYDLLAGVSAAQLGDDDDAAAGGGAAAAERRALAVRDLSLIHI